MGLDIAEFVIAVEEAFQINIMESDAQNIETLGSLVDYLERETAKSPHSKAEADYIFREGFLTLQRFLVKELGVDPAQLSPETEIAPLLMPFRLRRRLWRKMRKEISASIPFLYGKTYVKWGGAVAVFFGFFTFLFSVICLDDTVLSFAKFILGIVIGLATGFGFFLSGFFVFSPLFSSIPNDCRTLGGIARSAVRTKVSLDPNGRVWTRETIAEAVRRIAAEQTGMPVEKISFSERFIDLF